MRWPELDQDAGTWTLPAERAKNKRPLTLPLPATAWDIIEATPRRAFNDHLFGTGKNGFNNWSVTKKALDKRSGVTDRTIHDLRRTAATGMGNLGVHPHVIEAVLNHVSGHKRGVAGVYNRSSCASEMKTALALWADHVAGITDRAERKIIPLREIPA